MFNWRCFNKISQVTNGKNNWYTAVPPVNTKYQRCIGQCVYLPGSLEKPRGKAKEGRVAEVQQLASPQHLAASDTYSAVPRATSTSPPFFSFFFHSLPLPIFALFRPRPACRTTSNTTSSNSLDILLVSGSIARTMLHWLIYSFSFTNTRLVVSL